jgi:hypothetical protein
LYRKTKKICSVESTTYIKYKLPTAYEQLLQFTLPARKMTSNTRQCMVTPIASAYKRNGWKCSRRDWEEQQQLEKEGSQMNWDGVPVNRGRMDTNDIFCAVYNPTVSRSGKVIVYPITGTHDPTQRPSSWANSIGQGDRRVLDLGNQICEMDWETWISLGGHRKVQGSTRVKNPQKIVEYVERMETKETKDHTQLLEMILEETRLLSVMPGCRRALPVIQRRLTALNDYIKQRLV